MTNDKWKEGNLSSSQNTEKKELEEHKPTRTTWKVKTGNKKMYIPGEY